MPAVEHGFGFLREGALPQRFPPRLEPVYARTGVPVALPGITAVRFAPQHMMRGELGVLRGRREEVFDLNSD
ncbi:hypothetical protein [Streptomyces sp. SHP 1-2]|uniref:hypothetical protein n=1 Tax=Streptomyces sp. SHP 1-2 TaxID=2769489 RepID=UPI0022389680|nr:hypothetical protein [Streptomyces sp. SHP 1-2]MCW5249971.1 hypothetical protein [Streptomyces sp. SHP 1-2]